MARIETREQFTNVRIETRDYNAMKSAIKHSLRTVKIESNQKYVKRRIDGKTTWIDNPNHGKANMYWFNGEDPTKTDWTKEERKEKAKALIGELLEREDLHRKRLRKHKNRSLQKGRVYSWADGVFTLSDSIAEMVENDREKIFELGVKTIQHMCDELGITCHYITLDLDEAGLPHFQYYVDNFDEKGNAINASRRKEMGKRCQDLGNVFFNELGFKRGVPKEKSGRRHEDIRTYQENQDTKKELEAAEKKLAKTLARARKAENHLEAVKGQIEEKVLELIPRRDHVRALLEYAEKFEELAKFEKGWARYSKGKNMEKLVNHLEKYEKRSGQWADAREAADEAEAVQKEEQERKLKHDQAEAKAQAEEKLAQKFKSPRITR